MNERCGFQCLFKGGNKFVSGVRQQQISHILNADIIRAHSLAFFRKFNEILVRMNGARRVRNSDFADSAVFFDCLNRRFEVSHVVQRVENSDYVNTVFNRIFDKLLHYVVGVMLITQKVLTS